VVCRWCTVVVVVRCSSSCWANCWGCCRALLGLRVGLAPVLLVLLVSRLRPTPSSLRRGSSATHQVSLSINVGVGCTLLSYLRSSHSVAGWMGRWSSMAGWGCG
jgi:hypothetical protein